MIKRRFLFGLIFFAFTYISFSENKFNEKSNPYNLEIVSNLTDYYNSIITSHNNFLIDLEEIIEGIKLDIRYATKDNFTGEVIYSSPKAYLRKPAAEALLKVQDSLNKIGYELLIYDAYRPYSASLKFFEVYPDSNFVASPRTGSRHNRACAVDLTLIDKKTGNIVDMPTPFDDFSEKANPYYSDIPPIAKYNRDLLINVMSHFGFTVYPYEWWHFDYKEWNNYLLMDISFEELNDL